jgi:UDP-2,3-diacylglucosamine pyrophosphatase LpxH
MRSTVLTGQKQHRGGMMRIYACSDLHVSSEHFSNRARAFLEEAAQEADLTLLCGDIYEGTWCELKDSVHSSNGQELWNLIQAQSEAVILAGNHDWTLGDFLPADPQHRVGKNLRFEADGKEYYATHGWIEYDLSLSWLTPIYPWIFKLLPKLAKYWPRRKTPSEIKQAARQSRTSDQAYWRLVRQMANQAMYQAIDEGCVPIWGHSHRRHIDSYEGWLAINCGDFCQDDYGNDVGGIIIENGVPRRW